MNYERAKVACIRFYEIFEFMPDYIGMNIRQLKQTEKPYIKMDIVVHDKASNVFTNYQVELHPLSWVVWDDFILCSEKTGEVKQTDLDGLPMIKKMVESHGYRVILADKGSSYNMESFYVFDQHRFYEWTVPKNIVNYKISDIKYELDRFLLYIQREKDKEDKSNNG